MVSVWSASSKVKDLEKKEDALVCRLGYSSIVHLEVTHITGRKLWFQIDVRLLLTRLCWHFFHAAKLYTAHFWNCSKLSIRTSKNHNLIFLKIATVLNVKWPLNVAHSDETHHNVRSECEHTYKACKGRNASPVYHKLECYATIFGCVEIMMIRVSVSPLFVCVCVCACTFIQVVPFAHCRV